MEVLIFVCRLLQLAVQQLSVASNRIEKIIVILFVSKDLRDVLCN